MAKDNGVMMKVTYRARELAREIAKKDRRMIKDVIEIALEHYLKDVDKKQS